MKANRLAFPKEATAAKVFMGKKWTIITPKTQDLLKGIEDSEITEVQFGAVIKDGKSKSFAPLAVQPANWRPEPKPTTTTTGTEKPKASASKPAKESKEKAPTASSTAAYALATGNYTAKEVADQISKQFGKDPEAAMILVRSVIYRLNKQAKADGKTFTAKPSERTSGDSKLGYIREQFIAGTKTSAQVAEEVTAKFGGDAAKNKSLVYSAPYHFRKAGVKGGWISLPKAPKAPKAPKQPKAKAKKD